MSFIDNLKLYTKMSTVSLLPTIVIYRIICYLKLIRPFNISIETALRYILTTVNDNIGGLTFNLTTGPV